MLMGGAWFVPAVVGLIAVPITVRGLGDDGYGVMALVGAVTGYLGLLDLGLGQGIIRYLSMFVARGHGATVRECLKIVLGWFSGIGALGSVGIWVLTPWLVGSVLDIPADLTQQSIVAFRLGGLAFALGMIASVLSLVPSAFLRYDLVSLTNAALLSASLTGAAVLVSLGYGLVSVMWFGVVLNGVACLVWGFFVARLVRSIPNEGPRFREFGREFLGFSTATGVNRIWSVISVETARVVVGIAGGAAQVAYYQIPTVISRKVTGLLHEMNLVLLPTGSQMAAEGDHESLRELYKRSSRLFYVINACVSGAVVVFSAPLLEHWVGARYAQEGTLALVFLTLASMLNAASMSASYVNMAMGRPKINLAFSVANSVIQLAVVYSLTVNLGVTGTALSGLLAACVVPFFLHHSHSRVLSISSWEVLRDCYLRTILAVSAVGAISFMLLRQFASSLLLSIGLVAAVAALGLAASAASGAIDAADWASLKGVFRREAGATDESPAPSSGGGADG